MLALFAVASLAGPLVSQDDVAQYLRQTLKQKQVQGLAYAVMRRGRVERMAALGLANVEWRIAAGTDTVFEIGSITKQFTAALIMLLKVKGRLTLEDSVLKHLPEGPAHWKDVTIRHLLTHTSGLKNLNSLPGFELTEKLDRKKFVERLSPPPLDFKPGEKYQYGNTNYALLGFVAEAIEGKPYFDLLRERIFEPLQMRNSQNRNPLAVIPRRADGYDVLDGKIVNRDYDLTDVFAAGAIASTIADMTRWEAELEAASRGAGKVLTKQILDEMWSVNKLTSGDSTTYGLGFRIDTVKGRRVVGHGGSTSGFSSSIQRWPEHGLSVIVLTNCETVGVATEIARGIADLLLAK